MSEENGRRATPPAGVQVFPEPEGEVSLESLRSDIRTIANRQTAEVKVLHGRIGSLEKQHAEMSRQIGDLRVESGKQTTLLTVLVDAEKKRDHGERLELEQRAATNVELVKQGGVRRGFWMKIVGAIVAAVATALGGAAASGGL